MKPHRVPQIFISYALADRDLVDSLHRVVDIRLAQLLGVNISIWRDPKVPDETEAEFHLRRDPKTSGRDEPPLKSLAALHDAAALVCFVSSAYVQNERCLREFHEYIAAHTASQDGRIFKVMVGSVPVEKQPQLLSNLLAYQFYVTDPTTGASREFRMFGPDAEREFWLRADDLATDLAEVVRISRNRSEDFSFMQGGAGMLSITEPGTGERALRVFLCHASDDKVEVKALYRSLVRIGVDAWLDEEKLLPGQVWETEIPKAVKRSDAVVVCLSRKSLTKTGYVQKEIRYALDVADEHPEGALFIIPAKLEECEVPDRLSSRHWVNLFEDTGPGALARALQARATQLSVFASVMRS